MDEILSKAELILGASSLPTSGEIFKSVSVDREAGVALAREVCGFDGPNVNSDGAEKDLEDLDFMMPPFPLVWAYGDSEDTFSSKLDRLGDKFWESVDPVLSERLLSYFEENGIRTSAGEVVSNGSSLMEKRRAVEKAGDGAFACVVNDNLDSFVRGVDGKEYARLMGRFSVEKEADGFARVVFEKYKAGEVPPELAVGYAALKEKEYTSSCYAKGFFNDVAFSVTKDYLSGLAKDGPYDLFPRQDKKSRVVSVEMKSFIPGLTGKDFVIPHFVFGDGSAVALTLRSFSTGGLFSLMQDVAAERDRRELFYMHVTPDRVDDLVDILRKHGVKDEMKISVGSFGKDGRYIAVDGIRTAVPPEGVYVVYNPNLKTAVYQNRVFESLFDVRDGNRCTPKNAVRKVRPAGVKKDYKPNFN